MAGGFDLSTSIPLARMTDVGWAMSIEYRRMDTKAVAGRHFHDVGAATISSDLAGRYPIDLSNGCDWSFSGWPPCVGGGRHRVPPDSPSTRRISSSARVISLAESAICGGPGKRN